jgi:hypothetical protein
MTDGSTGLTARRVGLWAGLALAAIGIAVLIAVHPGPLGAFIPWVSGGNSIVGTQTFVAARGFASQQQLEEHFARDGAAFGVDSAAAYDALARTFFQNRSVWQQSATSTTIRLYDPKTNTFGSYTVKGVTISFFKPASGATYWAEVRSRRG